jgi:hypothetical protein
MARRALPLAALAALLLAGCGSEPSAQLTPTQEQARIAFVERHADFTDHQLARLCPGLYPRDFLTNEDKYPKAKRDANSSPPKATAADRAQAKAAGCDVRP